MENKDLSNGEKLKNALCYVPLVWVILFFTEQNKSKILMKHIKYWTYLFWAFILAQFILVSILMLPFGWILFLVYAWITWFLWWKSYNWEDINIEYIDEFEKKVKDNLSDEKVVKKTDVNEAKKENKKEDDNEDVLQF